MAKGQTVIQKRDGSQVSACQTQLPVSLLRTIRVAALEREVPLRTIVQEALERWVEREAKKLSTRATSR